METNSDDLYAPAQLPFRLSVSMLPIFAAGVPVTVSWILAAPSVEASRAVEHTLDVFEQLARTGGISNFCCIEHEPIEKLERHWDGHGKGHAVIYGSCLDQMAMVVLVQLFVASQSQTSLGVLIFDTGQDVLPLQTITTVEYSQAIQQEFRTRLPFHWSKKEPETGWFTLTLEFDEPVQGNTEDILREWISAWEQGVSAGAFSAPPIKPSDCWVEVDELFSYESYIEIGFTGLRADDMAFDVLMWILASVHYRIQSINNVDLS